MCNNRVTPFIFQCILNNLSFLCQHMERSGHIVLLFSVCLTSVCQSVTNLTCKLNITLLLLNYLSCKADIWHAATSHRYTSACTKVKVIYQG